MWSAAGSTAQDYKPKARPPSGDSFWQELRDNEKEPITNKVSAHDWLEIDLYAYSRIAVKKLVTEGDDNAMNALHSTMKSLRNTMESPRNMSIVLGKLSHL